MFTAFFNASPERNFGVLYSGSIIDLSVRGFTPRRGLLWEILNFPKPLRFTSFPSASVSYISLITELRNMSAWVTVEEVRAARSSMNCSLFTFKIVVLNYLFGEKKETSSLLRLHIPLLPDCGSSCRSSTDYYRRCHRPTC